VAVDGGAVEASWVLRSFDGRAISDCRCTEPEVSRVRLVVVPEAPDGTWGRDVCAGRAECEFPCRRQTGATPLDVPPGRYAISITALDASGRDLTGAEPGQGGVRVPAPILRDVVFGQPVLGDAFRIEAACAAACDGANKNSVCTRD
jgi:hypothetical protein